MDDLGVFPHRKPPFWRRMGSASKRKSNTNMYERRGFTLAYVSHQHVDLTIPNPGSNSQNGYLIHESEGGSPSSMEMWPVSTGLVRSWRLDPNRAMERFSSLGKSWIFHGIAWITEPNSDHWSHHWSKPALYILLLVHPITTNFT